MAWTAPGTQIGLYSEDLRDPRNLFPTKELHCTEEEMEVQGVGMISAPIGRATRPSTSHLGASVPFVTHLGQHTQRKDLLCLCNEIEG